MYKYPSMSIEQKVAFIEKWKSANINDIYTFLPLLECRDISVSFT